MDLKHLYLFFYVLIGLTSLLRTASAQNLMDTVSIYSLKDSLQFKSTTPVQVLGGQPLQRLNSLSVADVTRFFSGVQLKDYGGIGGMKTINVRSMGSNQSQVFLDGIALGNAQNGQVDLGKFSLEQVGEVRLYQGERTELLQPAKSYASSSSLYLETQVPSFDEQQTSHWKAGIKGGSFGLLNPSLTYQQHLNHQLAVSLNTEYLHANGRYRFQLSDVAYDTTVVRENADVEAFRFEPILYGKGMNNDWNVHAYFYQSDRGLPDAVVGNHYNPVSEERGIRQRDRNVFIQSSFHQAYDQYSFTIRGKYAHDYLFYRNPNILKLNGPLENNYYQQELYISAAQAYQFNTRWSAGLSTDWQWNKLNADLDNFVYPTRYTTLVSAMGQYKTERLTLLSSILSTFVQDHTQISTSAGNRTRLSPSASLSWQPFVSKYFRLRAFYKNSFRLPTFNDLYYTEIGNVQLKPEESHQLDLGATFLKSLTGLFTYLSLQGDIYDNQVKNKIIATPGANQFRWTMYNLDRVSIRGMELLVKSGLSLSEALQLDIGLQYTYERALNQNDAQQENSYNRGEQIPYIPRHSGSFIAQANYRKFQLNYSFLYVGERYSQASNNVENYLQPWYTHDLSLGKEIPLSPFLLRCSAEVNNVFNQAYEVVKGFPMPGRSLRFKISVNY